MSEDVRIEHFLKSAREIAAHGDNDTLPFDIDNRFISDCSEDLANIALTTFKRIDQEGADAVINSLSIFNERLLTPSGSSGFRTTTKIHPFWNLYINGIAVSIAERLEPLRSERAHSYRYSQDEVRLFSPEHSWVSYKTATIQEPLLDNDETVVVQTDISSFYEHVYHHRLENLISDLYSNRSTVPKQIDRILNQMSSGRSFGLPVGGQCARVLAEVMMNAVDDLMSSAGVVWHRFVDDFTLIASNHAEAYRGLSLLSKYLSDYGLTLNRSKTTLLSAAHYKNFVTAQLSTDGDESSKLKEVDLYYDPYSDNPAQEYEQLKSLVSEIDVIGLLRAETFKSQPDSYLVTQVARTLEFQTPHAAGLLCKTLLEPGNLNSFRASWSKVMRGISKIRADTKFEEVHNTIDESLDKIILQSHHLLFPEGNTLHFMRAIRFKKTSRRSMFVKEKFTTTESVTIKRACVDCWRNWNDRPSFLTAINGYDMSHPELQRMLWLSSFNFGDEGEHFRIRVTNKSEKSWALGVEAKKNKQFSSTFKNWTKLCGY